MQNSVSEMLQKDGRMTVPFDRKILDWSEKMANQEEESTARQVTLLVKSAIELIDEQAFRLVGRKLRRVTECLNAENV